jgi:hypothetical protein
MFILGFLLPTDLLQLCFIAFYITLHLNKK